LNTKEIITHVHERKEGKNKKDMIVHASKQKALLMKYPIEELMPKGELNEKDAFLLETKYKRSPMEELIVDLVPR